MDDTSEEDTEEDSPARGLILDRHAMDEHTSLDDTCLVRPHDGHESGVGEGEYDVGEGSLLGEVAAPRAQRAHRLGGRLALQVQQLVGVVKQQDRPACNVCMEPEQGTTAFGARCTMG